MPALAIAGGGADRPHPSYVRQSQHVAGILRLLVLLTCVLLGLSGRPRDPAGYWLAAAVYGGWLLLPTVLGVGDRIRGSLGGFVFLVDVVALSALIVMRGRELQELLVAVFTLMLLAAVVERAGNVLANVALVSAAYVGLVHWGAPAGELLSFANLAHLVLFIVTASLMTHTASATREQAAARRRAERHRRNAQLALHAVSTDLRSSKAKLAQATESLRANERLITLGMLSAGVSHEIRNPLAVLVAGVRAAREMAAEQAAGEGAGAADLDEALQTCGLACDHLQRIVDGLGNLARAGETRTGAVDLATTLDAGGRLLDRLTGPDIELCVEATACRLAQADPGRVLQVVLNLGRNALDAMREEGGRLELACRDEPDGRVALVVADTGPGMDEHLAARVFEPFVTTKAPGEGTGLGLHLVAEIVRSHGGEIDLHTAPGRGTRFTVRLPAVPDVNGEETTS